MALELKMWYIFARRGLTLHERSARVADIAAQPIPNINLTRCGSLLDLA
jgi:hypothetical protein